MQCSVKLVGLHNFNLLFLIFKINVESFCLWLQWLPTIFCCTNWAQRLRDACWVYRILMKSDLQIRIKRKNHSLNSQLRQLTNYKELYLTTDTLQFFVDNTSLWSGVQCFYKQFLLWLLLLNFIASQLVTVWLLIKYATFWSGKTMVYLNLVSVALALCSVKIKGT